MNTQTRKKYRALVEVDSPAQLQELVRLASNAEIGIAIDEQDVLSEIRDEFPAVAADLEEGELANIPRVREQAMEMMDGEEMVRLTVLLDSLEER